MASSRQIPRLVVLLALAAWSAAGAGALRGTLVVEDFEAFAWGGDWLTLHCTERADPRILPVRDGVHSGQQAARLDVPPGESLTLITQHGTEFTPDGGKPPLPLPGAPERIGIWVRGRDSGHRLSVRLLDAERNAEDVELGTVDFEGWRLLEAKVPGLTPPLGLRGLTVRGGRGPLVVDDLVVTTAVKQPLHLAVQPAYLGPEPVDDARVQFRIVVQTVGPESGSGRGEVAAFPVGEADRVADRRTFSYDARPGEPYRAEVRLSLAAGVYRLVALAGDAEAERRIVVFPGEAAGEAPSARRAIRRFGERRDALWVYESALSPAVVIESREPTVTLFRGLPALGLTAPQDSLMRVKKHIGRAGMRREFVEPWLLVWFGASPLWYRVTFADGSPCPTFDVPFLVVLEREPEAVDLDEQGLRLSFRRRAGRVAVMPLLGVHRPSPSETTRWREDVEAVRQVVEQCRWWARALRAYPVGVEPGWRVDPEADEVEVRLAYEHLWWGGGWDDRPLETAPVPPLLALAAGADFPVTFAARPHRTGCSTAVGPAMAVPDADECRYTVRGLLRHVHQVLAGAEADAPLAQLGLSAQRKTLAADAAKIPFWARQLGERGGLVAEGAVRTLLWERNARYVAADGRVAALDGLAWQVGGERAAAAAVAEQLRGCWYAAAHAGCDAAVRAHWRHVASLREALREDGAWATLGLGTGGPGLDARLNAEVFFARLAARLGDTDAYRDACGRIVHLMAAGHALVAGAPRYVQEHRPWPTLVGRGQGERVFGQCLGGSLGLAPGPLPFVTSPSDAGYGYASRRLSAYFQERFRGGAFDYYGESAAAWRTRKRVALEPPRVSSRFYWPPAARGRFAGNGVFDVQAGPDGWPALAWASHKAPKGGPLLFGTIGTAPGIKGKLRATRLVSPYLRLSAYVADE